MENMKNIYKILQIILVLLLSLCASCSHEQEKEEKAVGGRQEYIIIDDAEVLQDKAQLMHQYTAYNAQMLKDFDIDFRVITTKSSQDINSYANKAFERLQSKSRSQTGKALLMVVNVAADQVRLEVSMALEPIYTDAFVAYTERKGLVPYFRNSRIADGIYMMTELVYDRAVEAEQGNEFMPPMESQSIGGGAKTAAQIGQKDPDAQKGSQVYPDPDDTPENIMDKYLAVLKEHNKNPDLAIYTDATKQFYRNRTRTDINQDNEYRFMQQCNKDKKLLYSPDRAYAVLMNDPVQRRTCAPYFFKKEDNTWKLDIAVMAKVIRFNYEMKWHFDMQKKKEHLKPYAFAFNGLTYDKNGFPYVKQRKAAKKLRWGFGCDEWYRPGEREKIRCRINMLTPDGAAKNQLGLHMHDKIIGIGKGTDPVDDPTLDEFMAYMKNTPAGKQVTVLVERDRGRREELQAAAP
jgi:uncharacterized protein